MAGWIVRVRKQARQCSNLLLSGSLTMITIDLSVLTKYFSATSVTMNPKGIRRSQSPKRNIFQQEIISQPQWL